MKFNKWTLGLAAVGAVSLASAARADEKMNSLQTALSDTTISGYVSASANWAITPGGGLNQRSLAGFIPYQGQFTQSGTPSKQDGFNLDVVKLTIAKPEDESPWASGYQVDLLFGPDAVNYNASANAVGGQSQQHFSNENGADFAIKQAYVTLRTPVGNGIDWKIGVFDTIIGYEVFDAGSNPNYTRSWGFFLEPTEHTGILASYKVNDEWSFSAGVANTLMAGINARNNESGFSNGEGSDWHKTLMGSVTFTAPSSWGWAAGSSIYSGFVYGFNGSTVGTGGAGGASNNYTGNYYFGTTMNTPWKKLTTGLAFDYVQHPNLGGGPARIDVWDLGLYATFKATDKLSFSGRAEYLEAWSTAAGASSSFNPDWMELTATVEYDLWANVMTRVELRWDHVIDNLGTVEDTFDTGLKRTSLGLYANVIYKF